MINNFRFVDVFKFTIYQLLSLVAIVIIVAVAVILFLLLIYLISSLLKISLTYKKGDNVIERLKYEMKEKIK